jgi:hypothetical protein
MIAARLAILSTLAAGVLSMLPAGVSTSRAVKAVSAVKFTADQLEQIKQLKERSIKIDPDYRAINWGREGSCAWASMVNLLHWQGRHDMAEYVRAHYSEGAGPQQLYPAMDRLGIPYASCEGGDEQFLTWACRTRRGSCVVVNGGSHMINLVGLDSQYAYTLDNNSDRRTMKRPRSVFMSEWRRSGGWAFTPVYSPAAPKPWIVKI